MGIARSDWVLTLDAMQAALARRIDGHRTIDEISDGIVDVATALALLESLWRLDFISVRLPTADGDQAG